MVHAPACKGWRILRMALVLSVTALTPLGCVSYEPAPLDPRSILHALESQTLAAADAEAADGAAPPDLGLTPERAMAFAVTHNPALVARRAAEGVALSQLVLAGLLPDPVLAFDSMDAVAAKVSGDDPAQADYVSGIGLSWVLPRPGELGARQGIAQANVDLVRQRILQAEWQLARSVHLAFIDVQAADARLDLNRRTIVTAQRTADFFTQALAVRAATAMQENLAAVELMALQQGRVQLEGEARLARQRLNGLMGLPPQAHVQLKSVKDAFAVEPQTWDADVLVKQALDERPDLAALLAAYRASEEALKLEIARQWPAVSVGTGISLVVALFSQFNRPAIELALRERQRIGLEVRAAIHLLRSEVNLALEELRRARRAVQFFETTLDPRLKQSLRLADQAFRARELTLVEILTAQRQVLEATKTYLETRLERVRARVVLDTITGSSLTQTPDSHAEKPERDR